MLVGDAETNSALKLIRGKTHVTAKAGLSLCAGDIVSVSKNAVALLSLIQPSGSEQDLVISDDATVVLVNQQAVVQTLGRLFARIRGYFDVATTAITLGARGTEFQVDATPNGSSVSVIDGRVTADSHDVNKGGGLSEWIRLHVLNSPRKFPTVKAIEIGPLQKFTIAAGAEIPIRSTVTPQECASTVNSNSVMLAAARPEYPSASLTTFYISSDQRIKAFQRSWAAVFCDRQSRSAHDLEILGDVYADWADGDSALTYYTQALEVDPGAAKNGLMISKVANAFRLRGDLETAERKYKQALETDKTLFLAYSGLGDVYSDRGRVKIANMDHPEAVPDLKLAVSYYEKALDSNRSDSGLYRAVTYYHLGSAFALLAISKGIGDGVFGDEIATNFAAAELNFQNSLKEWPNYPFAQTAHAYVLLTQAQAYDTYISAVGHPDPRIGALRSHAATLIDQAEHELVPVLKMQDRFAFGHFLLGEISEERGSYDKTLQEYRTAIELDPLFAEAYNRIGGFLSTMQVPPPPADAASICTYLAGYVQTERPIMRTAEPYQDLVNDGRVTGRRWGKVMVTTSNCNFSVFKK